MAKTNTLAAAALSLGVNEELLEAVIPSIKNGEPADLNRNLVSDLLETGRSLKISERKLIAAREVNGEAVILGQMFEELMNRLRNSEHGKAFIAMPLDDGTKPNYAFLHRMEEQYTRLKASRVRLTCESDNGAGRDCQPQETKETSGS